MAVFDVTVRSNVDPNLLGPVFTQTSGCFTVHEMAEGGSDGDSLTIVITPTVGYTDYVITLDEGSGFNSIPDNHTFTRNDQINVLRIVMENDGTTNNLEITIDATNNTTAQVNQKIVSRLSTGAPC